MTVHCHIDSSLKKAIADHQSREAREIKPDALRARNVIDAESRKRAEPSPSSHLEG